MDGKLKRKLSQLKLLALDVDGVLTDGSIYYSDNDYELKAFNVKDGYGLKQLIKAGIDIGIITSRRSKALEKRAHELGIKEIKQGIENKAEALTQLCEKLNVDRLECAYMGDDLPDIEAMLIAGVSLSVSDAVQEIVDVADWVSHLPGGKGAVREACEIILKSINARPLS